MNFNPNNPSTSNNIFRLPCQEDKAKLILLPVPWEVTTSYGRGTANGPEVILNASYQVDLYHSKFGDFYNKGIYFTPIDLQIKKLNQNSSERSQKVIQALETSQKLDKETQQIQNQVNEDSAQLNNWVYESSQKILDQNKIVGLIGGDHSTPYGLIKALSQKNDFSILHIDAHADLRDSYQGFHHSHASIMANVLKLDSPPKKIVQVGIRDYCPQEAEVIKQNQSICCFFDLNIKKNLFNGVSWKAICKKIISNLTDKIYISFDIDGLSPDLCPNTGTPVPGGLNYDQILFLLFEIAEQKKQVIGFDLVEVSPSTNPTDEWDGNVGARILYQLCGLSLFAK